MYLFKLKGAGTFLQTHGFLFLKEEIFKHNYVLLPKFLQVHKVDRLGMKILINPQSGQITQRGWKFLLVHKMDGSPKEGENSYKVHKVDGSPREDENSYQSTK